MKISFVYLSVFLPTLPSIFCFRLVHTISALFCDHLCMKYSLFPPFLCIGHQGSLSYLSLLFIGTLHSNRYIVRFLLAFRSLLFTAICKASQTAMLLFCISFPWGWSWSLPPIQCHKSLFIVLQAPCVSDLTPWIYFSLPLYNCKGFDLGHT